MARIIAGIDISGGAVRVALVEASGRQLKLLGTTREPVGPDEGSEAALARILGGIETPVDQYVGLFSLHQVSLRTVKLPFSDRKKIDQVLPFELEGLFPFDPEEAVLNYLIVAPGEEETELLVAAARSELVAARLQAYKDAGHEPRHLWLDGFTLESAWRAGGGAWPEVEGEAPTMAFLHLDIDESLVQVARADGYRAARGFRLGRRELTRRLAAAGAQEAGDVEAALERGESVALEAWLAPLAREIQKTFVSFEKTARVRPSRLVVSGEAARWPGFADRLAELLGLPVEALGWSGEAAGETDGVPGDFAPLLGAVAQSVAGGGIDLRTGEFTYTRAIQLVRGKLLVTAGLALALVLIVVLGNVFTYLSKDAEAEALQSEIVAIFQESFPNEPIVDPVQQMNAQVRQMRRGTQGAGGMTVVDMLKNVSAAVGPDMKFEIRELHRDASGYRIKGETDSYENIGAIEQKIEAVEGIKDVTVSDSKTTAQGAILFELTIVGDS